MLKFDVGIAGKGRHLETGECIFGYMWFYCMPDIHIKSWQLDNGTISAITIRWFIFYCSITKYKVEMNA